MRLEDPWVPLAEMATFTSIVMMEEPWVPLAKPASMSMSITAQGRAVLSLGEASDPYNLFADVGVPEEAYSSLSNLPLRLVQLS